MCPSLLAGLALSLPLSGLQGEGFTKQLGYCFPPSSPFFWGGKALGRERGDFYLLWGEAFGKGDLFPFWGEPLGRERGDLFLLLLRGSLWGGKGDLFPLLGGRPLGREGGSFSPFWGGKAFGEGEEGGTSPFPKSNLSRESPMLYHSPPWKQQPQFPEPLSPCSPLREREGSWQAPTAHQPPSHSFKGGEKGLRHVTV